MIGKVGGDAEAASAHYQPASVLVESRRHLLAVACAEVGLLPAKGDELAVPAEQLLVLTPLRLVPVELRAPERLGVLGVRHFRSPPPARGTRGAGLRARPGPVRGRGGP